MTDKLPYDLSTGITATREGLVVRKDALTVQAALLAETHGPKILIGWQTVFPWPEIAEQVRFQRGEPWCRPSGKGIYCAPASESTWVTFGTTDQRQKQFRVLHRLAAILADDAEAFRVLHWCLHNLAENP